MKNITKQPDYWNLISRVSNGSFVSFDFFVLALTNWLHIAPLPLYWRVESLEIHWVCSFMFWCWIETEMYSKSVTMTTTAERWKRNDLKSFEKKSNYFIFFFEIEIDDFDIYNHVFIDWFISKIKSCNESVKFILIWFRSLLRTYVFVTSYSNMKPSSNPFTDGNYYL